MALRHAAGLIGYVKAGVVEDLADELVNGRGLGIVLRQHGTDEAVLEAAD